VLDSYVQSKLERMAKREEEEAEARAAKEAEKNAGKKDKKPDKKKDAKGEAPEVNEIEGLETEPKYAVVDRDFRGKNKVKKAVFGKDMKDEDKNKAIEAELKSRFDIMVPLKERLAIRVALN